MFYNKRELKGKNISISEHLSPQRLDLLNKTKDTLPKGTKVWTSQGTIFTVVHGEKRAIKNYYDLSSYTKYTDDRCHDSMESTVPPDGSSNKQPPGT